LVLRVLIINCFLDYYYRAQRAYCAQIQGREKEALATYSRVLKSKPTDGGLIAVASNNIVCINKDQNIFDSKKRIKTFFVEGVLHKLNRIQRRSLLLNQCLFNFHTQQVV
jgi:signal recognition particle subunit SRP72